MMHDAEDWIRLRLDIIDSRIRDLQMQIAEIKGRLDMLESKVMRS